MGEEISEGQGRAQDLVSFREKVQEETRILRSWFDDRKMASNEACFGVELEGWLIDPKDARPAPKNHEFLEALNHEQFVPELSKYNFEINSLPQSLCPEVFSKMQQEIHSLIKKSRKVASSNGMEALWIGVLPTIEDSMLDMDAMTQQNRYYALAERISEIRNGEEFPIHIDRFDSLDLSRKNILIEAAATSLQIHAQVSQDEAAEFYNVSSILSGPLVALSANSPFLYGKRLWDETRIPIFEQTLSLKNWVGEPLEPVTFGDCYLESCVMELFDENLSKHTVILPSQFDSEPEELRHLKFLNGQIWRWNRPIIGIVDGKPHVRIEHRALPAGPTSTDVVANVAFYVGLLYHYTRKVQKGQRKLDFEKARKNFYNCSRNGLAANVHWFGDRQVNVLSLLQNELMMDAHLGLKELGVSREDIDYYIGNVIQTRLRNHQNGANWQKSFIDKYGNDFSAMTLAYLERQKSGQFVGEWKV